METEALSNTFPRPIFIFGMMQRTGTNFLNNRSAVAVYFVSLRHSKRICDRFTPIPAFSYLSTARCPTMTSQRYSLH